MFTVGKSYDKNIDNLYLGADEVLWSPRLKYLGLTFKAGKSLNVEFESAIRKLYTAANSICANTKYASEITKLFLMESYSYTSHQSDADQLRQHSLQCS